MKIAEVLLEFKEYFDSYHYGAWVNAQSKEVYYVDEFGHRNEMLEIAEKVHGMDSESLAMDDDLNQSDISPINAFAYSNNYVRLVFDQGHGMEIEGTRPAFAALSRQLLSSALQPGIPRVVIDMVDQTGEYLGAKTFTLPTQKIELQKFIRNEA